MCSLCEIEILNTPVMAECPKCHAEQEDLDGIGVVYCQACGYCAHVSASGNLDGEMRCDTCGDALSLEDARE